MFKSWSSSDFLAALQKKKKKKAKRSQPRNKERERRRRSRGAGRGGGREEGDRPLGERIDGSRGSGRGTSLNHGLLDGIRGLGHIDLLGGH